jgi:hypothetical protein
LHLAHARIGAWDMSLLTWRGLRPEGSRHDVAPVDGGQAADAGAGVESPDVVAAERAKFEQARKDAAMAASISPLAEWAESELPKRTSAVRFIAPRRGE